MVKRVIVLLSACVALSLSAATLAAPEQSDRPGVVVQPRVTVENRGRGQAIPVSIQAWEAGERPLFVQISGSPTVEVRRLPQAWTYRTVKVSAGQDMAGALAAAGAEGWEATGGQTSDSTGTVLLLKRPR